ncbi:hypothetical protein E4H83_12885 [Salmonella enterica]|uniref:Uncharacterized protein n=3 Tax=Salmonella enterica TaxID=28901 RepID=A0A2I5HMZ4_SALDZ|nr:hypothetical protein CNQ75_21570 [Salmonella enterica subsp. diarizonae]AXC70198.1 hypothetical protein DOE59_00350 [Salmonella enterica subsp. diarizonae serovar 48:i:z]AXD69539.1 hypothetical protein CHC34_00325 [Salmonella enterica]EAA1780186.1 hypothetical protein [Salmonella enterica subsp. diarizonae]EAA4449429.1 hypothetical protein [Salmonella enterica subsp. diarizonae]
MFKHEHDDYLATMRVLQHYWDDNRHKGRLLPAGSASSAGIACVNLPDDLRKSDCPTYYSCMNLRLL